MIPQLVIIILMFMSLTLHIAKDGEDRGKYDGGNYFITMVIQLSILYWGGFFDVMLK